MVRPRPSRLRIGATAMGVGLLFWVVAVLAGDVPGDEPAGSIVTVDRAAVANWTVPALRFAYLAALIVALYTWLVGRQPRPGGRGRKRVPMVATFLALVMGAVLMLVVFPSFRTEPEAVVPTTMLTGTASPEVTAPPNGPSDISTSPAAWWAPVVLALAGAVYLASRRQRDIEMIVTDGPRAAPLALAVERRHRSQDDPAERVLAAYRRVEEASSGRGLGRAQAETAARHLERLAPVASEEATGALTSLFHRARYSSDSIDADDASAAERHGRRIVDGLDE